MKQKNSQKLFLLSTASLLLCAALVDCSSGTNTSAQIGVLNPLQQYVAMLQYSPHRAALLTKNLQSAIGYQQSFLIESTETLSSISIKYYSDPYCNNLVQQHDLNGPATLFPGTYTSSDQSNYALCSDYPNGCSGLLSAVESANGWSMKYVYHVSDGTIYSGSCMSNPGNPIGKSAEFIANYASETPLACTEKNSSCGFSQPYAIVLSAVVDISTTPAVMFSPDNPSYIPVSQSGESSSFTINVDTDYMGSIPIYITPISDRFNFSANKCIVSKYAPTCSIIATTIAESVTPGNIYPITFNSNGLTNPESINIYITYASYRVGESMPLPNGGCNPCGMVTGLAVAGGNILASFSNAAGIYTIPTSTSNTSDTWTYFNHPYAHQVLTYDDVSNILYGVGGNDAMVFDYNPFSIALLPDTYATQQIGRALNNIGAVQYGLAYWGSTLYVSGTDAGGAIPNPPVCYGPNTLTSSQQFTCVNNNNESSYTNSLLQVNGYLYQGRGDYSVWYVELNSDHSIPAESSAWQRLGITPTSQLGYNNSRIMGLAYDSVSNQIYISGSPKKGWNHLNPALCKIAINATPEDNWSCVTLNTDPILRLALDPSNSTAIYGSTYDNSVIHFKK